MGAIFGDGLGHGYTKTRLDVDATVGVRLQGDCDGNYIGMYANHVVSLH